MTEVERNCAITRECTPAQKFVYKKKALEACQHPFTTWHMSVYINDDYTSIRHGGLLRAQTRSDPHFTHGCYQLFI